jgi:hypothetical protein
MVYAIVVLDPAGSYYAGDYTTYTLNFKTLETIPTGSYLILDLPDEFQISKFPACYSPSLNGLVISGDIYCSKFATKSSILIDGISG